MRFDRGPVYEKNLARIHEWIRAADQKLSIFVALQAALILGVTPMFLTELAQKQSMVGWQLIIAIIAAYVFFTCGLIACLISLYSNLEVKQKGKKESITEDQLSLTFFNHISNMTSESYKTRMRRMSKKTYEEELLSQVYASAGIATKKHRYFNASLVLFVVGMAISILSLGWLYLS